MKQSSSQFFVCSKGCFSLDPGFKCAHEGGKGTGSGEDIVLILDDEPGAGRSPGEKIYADREQTRGRYEKRSQDIARRREAIEIILLAVRKELVKTNRWTDLMFVGDQFPQLPAAFHYWPSRLAFVVRDLVWKLDEANWTK